MRQFNAVMMDALRLLRARVLFWITLGISAFAALIYLSIGFNESGISVLFGLRTVENEFLVAGSVYAEQFYLAIFGMFIVNVWLSWIAIILALISCAPVFPEFSQEGSAGAALCKPISRWRLFSYKYLTGLLFAALQTTVFCIIVFFALKLRLGHWNPSVFWAVPLIVIMFSYIWAVTTLVGIKTKSVMAAVLASIAFWFCCWLAKTVEESNYSRAELGVSMTIMGPVELTEEEQLEAKASYPLYSLPFKILPKTTDTVNLLQRWIVVRGESEFSATEIANMAALGEPVRDEQVEEGLKRHSAFFILASSLAFEFVVLLASGWMFCRRDF
ncbi:MAG: hypothetical protein ACQKBU_11740 [Verrucomicrobiales bacterium]